MHNALSAGIAWQKKSHHKYFLSLDTYKTWYKLLVRATRCHSVPLSDVFQSALVKWLYRNKEGRAASWFEKYWTGERGNWTRGHAGVAGTNNNNGLESRWKRFKTAVCGGSGSCAGLSPGVVIPAANWYLCELSKEEASRLRCDTAKRHAVHGRQPVRE